jgi:glycosyltransferase involved in cell wall biosynthesis
MNVTISVCGSFPGAYHYGRYLEERGRLTRLINPLPVARTRRFGVSRSKVRSLWFFGGCIYLNNEYVPSRMKPWAQYGLQIGFDRAAAHELGSPDIVNAWETCALATIRRAHQLGLKAVLHTGSTHIASRTAVLRDEYRRFGFDGPLMRGELVRRTLDEYEEADAVVVPSRVAKESFVKKGIAEAKVFVVPWAGKPVTGPPSVPRRPARPRILFVGTCSLRKGIPYLFAAFRTLGDRAGLRLVGPTSDRVFGCAGGIPEGVEVLGPLHGERLAQVYRDADVFVLASVEEGSAYVVREAMAAGLPVVVTDRVGADYVSDGVNGFVVPACDSAALAAKLGELIDDDDLRDRLGAAAAACGSERTWRAYGADLDEQVFRPIYEQDGGSRG